MSFHENKKPEVIHFPGCSLLSGQRLEHSFANAKIQFTAKGAAKRIAHLSSPRRISTPFSEWLERNFGSELLQLENVKPLRGVRIHCVGCGDAEVPVRTRHVGRHRSPLVERLR
jgi:hypothetical protein